jgi:hypothetical protein
MKEGLGMKIYWGELTSFGNHLSKKLLMISTSMSFFCLMYGVSPADTLWTPSIGLTAIQDDNIRFISDEVEDSSVEEDSSFDNDDYIYVVQPKLKLDYEQELTQIATDASVLIRRYQDNDEFDDEIYRFNLDGRNYITERFNLRGRYRFIKDTTLDSELEETGRIFAREDRFSHDALLAPSFNLTERTSIGVTGRYRNVAYDSDANVDYSFWSLGLPVRRRLETQIDTIYINPEYTYRDSDTRKSDSYSLRVGWTHETTERLNLDLSVGSRYTEHEQIDTDSMGVTEEENWSTIAELKLRYAYETGDLFMDFEHDLQNTADGEQVNVTKIITRLRWDFKERIGLELEGRYYYTLTEGSVDDDATEYMLFKPELYYNLTEEHVLFIAYEYSQEDQTDVENEPRAERNRIWAGIKLNFPM